MDFKRSAAIARKAIRDMEEIPYRNVMQEMVSGWLGEKVCLAALNCSC